MAKYSYKYSGPNAAFVFAGVATLPAGIAVVLEAAQHKELQKNKFAKHLVESGELEIQEIPDDEPKAAGKTGGKGGKSNDAASDASKAADEAALAAVKAELAALEVTFSDDETLEQLQAKLDQAKE
ncbi:hypothetical protein KTG55_02785 [Acinetobacter pittii]|uniref:hypothetical protein n=1 Tax=Acinetobacter pittii TaxID=48296 RepID=UPI0021D272BE|nr:hypothetical protein [Acinetobacter pittii]MCU4328721.1 hypothetical protein [Acinetobacter pittii]